ncbi:hypothetical protein M758_UG149800 [Ceratodon purpureus]|nr:hypothetical protein M758_UG149800 [Ceratodon purpureus]
MFQRTRRLLPWISRTTLVHVVKKKYSHLRKFQMLLKGRATWLKMRWWSQTKRWSMR